MPPPQKKKVEKEKMQAMLTQSVYVCLCVHMMDVEDIMSSHRANTEWVTAGLGWISLTGEQRLSLS